MSFHEKSAWACLLGILLVFVPYFYVVFQYPLAFVGLFAVAVAALCLFLIVFHTLNAIMSPSIRKSGDAPKRDELDRMIELQAAKISGIVLGVVVIAWCLLAMLGGPILGIRQIAAAKAATDSLATPEQFAIPLGSALMAIHTMFAGFVVANLVYYGSLIVGYRRLNHG